jgi:TldD protein
VNLMLEMMSKVIDETPTKDVIFADMRHESHYSTQIAVSNGGLRRFSRASKAGTVARALVGECWGVASSSESLSKSICKSILSEAIKSAKANARFSRKSLDMSNVRPIEKSLWQKCKSNPAEVSSEDKLELVMALDAAQKIDERIVHTNSTYNDSKKVSCLVNSSGSRLEWDELRIQVAVQPVAREANRMQFDYHIHGGRTGYELIRTIDPSEFGGECARGAIDLLSAEKPPSGKMTVIADGDIAGLIAHEVCGHASEADEVVKKRSFLTDLVGVQVGTENVTMIDDGTLYGGNGSYPFDSEGTPASRTQIIENGSISYGSRTYWQWKSSRL